MDPSGGWFFKIFVGIIVCVIALWVLAPFTWALGISIGLFVAFFILVFYILSNTKFT